MVIFENAGIFIQSCTTIKEKIAAIDLIIDALLLTAANSASSTNISEYSLNDGQTIIRTLYRGTDGVLKAVTDFEKLRIMYVNRLNGHVFRLIDSKSLSGRYNGR